MKPIIKPVMTIDELRFYKYLKSVKSPFLHNINELIKEKEQVLSTQIPKIFSTYTLHDINHSFRILEHCFDLVTNVKNISQLEITILIYAAVLHDIGMAVSSDEITTIKKEDYQYKGLKFSSLKKLRGDDENIAIQDFIRKIHADRSSDYVLNEPKDKYLIPEQTFLDFKQQVAIVCASHGKDVNWILENCTKDTMLGEYPINLQYCCFLLRIGDLLDFDSNRTPPILYQMIAPSGYSEEEWKQHFIINNFRKIFEKAGQKIIRIEGESNESKIHRKFMHYIDWIEIEVQTIINATKSSENHISLI